MVSLQSPYGRSTHPPSGPARRPARPVPGPAGTRLRRRLALRPGGGPALGPLECAVVRASPHRLGAATADVGGGGGRGPPACPQSPALRLPLPLFRRGGGLSAPAPRRGGNPQALPHLRWLRPGRRQRWLLRHGLRRGVSARNGTGTPLVAAATASVYPRRLQELLLARLDSWAPLHPSTASGGAHRRPGCRPVLPE